MSTVVRRGNYYQEPPKKSRAGLIITIIVIIIVIIAIVVIIFFVLRSRNTPPPGGCLSDPDCPTGKVCNTVTKTCLGCLTSANCTGDKKTCDLATNTCVGCTSSANCTGATPVCDTVNQTCVGCVNNSNCAAPQICDAGTKTCIAPECTNAADCAFSTSDKACNAGLCVECNSNLDCVNNPFHADAGRNTCDTVTHNCKECLTNVDCPGGTCQGGVCCITSAPAITLVTSTRGPNCKIAFTYTTSQNLTGLTYIAQLSDPVSGGVIYTSPATATGSVTTTGQVILTDTAMGIFLIPGVSYNVKIKLVTACGPTDFSVASLTTIPADNSAGTCPAASGKIPAPAGPVTADLILLPPTRNDTTAWAVVSKTSGIHPNLAEMIKSMTQVDRVCIPDAPDGALAACDEIGFETSWATGITPLLGETWYIRVFLAQGYDAAVPGSLASISGLSTEKFFNVTL